MLPTLVFARLRAARTAAFAVAVTSAGLLGPVAAGDAAPVQLVKQVNATTADATPGGVVSLGGSTGYFLAKTGGQNRDASHSALLRTDGTAAGTTVVKDLSDPAADDVASSLTVVGGALYFVRPDATGTPRLWTSNGTEAGTAQVAWTTSGSSDTKGLAIVGTAGSSLLFTAATFSAEGIPTSTTLFGLASGSTTATVIATAAGTVTDVTTATDGSTYFVEGLASGPQLWRAPAAGAAASLHTWAADAAPQRLTTLGTRLFFALADPADGSARLWSSDGTAGGTQAVSFGAATDAPFTVTGVKATSDALYVTGQGQPDPDDPDAPAAATPIWRIPSGSTTPAGIATPGIGAPRLAAVVGPTVFLTDDFGPAELWKTTGAAPVAVTSHDPADGNASVAVVGASATRVFFVDHGTELWSSDGTVGAAKLLSSTYGEVDQDPSGALFTTVGAKTYFDNRTTAQGAEPWTTDAATAAGTGLLKDINAQPNDADIHAMVSMGGKAYFIATDGTPNSTELWASDGTGAGTTLVAHLDVAGRGSFVRGVAATPHGIAIATGNGLWWSDGTAAGTHTVVPLAGADDGFDALDPEAVGDKVVFNGPGEHTPLGLWVTDGTDAGTTRIADLPSRPTTSEDDEYEPTYLTAGSQAYFTGYDAAHGYETWHTDGTAAGTGLVADLNPGTGDTVFSNVAVAGDHLVFSGSDAQGRPRVWATNAAGTRATALTDTPLAEMPAAIASAGGVVYLAVKNQLVTVGRAATACGDPSSGPAVVTASDRITSLATLGEQVVYVDASGKLGLSDGTAGGTSVLHAFGGGATVAFTSTASGLWFTETEAATGSELWHTDGTAAGTTLVGDFAAGPTSGNPTELTVAGGNLVFGADDAVHGRQLAGTALGAAITPPARVIPPCLPPVQTPTPSAAATPTPATTATPTPAPKAPVAPKVTPKSFTLKLASKTDAKAPYKYTFSGVLTLPAGALLKEGCAGDVEVVIKRGKKVVATKSVGLKVLDGACTYKVAVKVPARKLAKKGSLKASVHFTGSARLAAAKTPKAVTLRYGHH